MLFVYGYIKTIFKPVLLALFAFTLILSSSHQANASNQKLTFVGGKKTDSPAVQFLVLLYTEAFKRLNYDFEYLQMPGKRASSMSDSGAADGEISRIFTYGKTHPNVIRVDEENYREGFFALSINPSIKVEGWESLRGSTYRIGYRRGPKVTKVNLPPVVDTDHLTIVNSVKSGLLMLQRNRIDLYIDAESDLLFTMNSTDFSDLDFNVAGQMNEFSAHMFLNKKHVGILNGLNKVLKSMRHEGVFEKFRIQAGFLSINLGN